MVDFEERSPASPVLNNDVAGTERIDLEVTCANTAVKVDILLPNGPKVRRRVRVRNFHFCGSRLCEKSDD